MKIGSLVTHHCQSEPKPQALSESESCARCIGSGGRGGASRVSLVGVVRGVEARLEPADAALLGGPFGVVLTEEREASDDDREVDRVLNRGDEVGLEIMLLVMLCSLRSFLSFFFLMGPNIGGGISLEPCTPFS